jgi:putative flippase GtrA
MAKMLTVLAAIIGTTFLFALIGVGVAFIAVFNLPDDSYTGGKDEDIVVLLSVLPPLLGTILGFIVGIIAAFVARRAAP